MRTALFLFIYFMLPPLERVEVVLVCACARAVYYCKVGVCGQVDWIIAIQQELKINL